MGLVDDVGVLRSGELNCCFVMLVGGYLIDKFRGASERVCGCVMGLKCEGKELIEIN